MLLQNIIKSLFSEIQFNLWKQEVAGIKSKAGGGPQPISSHTKSYIFFSNSLDTVFTKPEHFIINSQMLVYYISRWMGNGVS